ncbi:MAG TPA: 50S ribosomal protein L29 [Candidatus Paceibacterota bacterium]|nr:50S ribosomal protein L29 [Candidatus Paceibacterota bacterium]
MKIDKVKEFKAKTREDLDVLRTTIKEKLERLRFDLKSGKTAAVKEIRDLKKQIAIILTLINEHDRKNSTK